MKVVLFQLVMDSAEEYMRWKDLAVQVCKLCGSKIMENVHRRSYIEKNASDSATVLVFSEKMNSADLVTETDQLVEDTIKDFIKQHFPSHSFVGEETASLTGGKL